MFGNGLARFSSKFIQKNFIRGLRSHPGSSSRSHHVPAQVEETDNVVESTTTPRSLSTDFDQDFVREIAGDPPISFNFAPYVNGSNTLKQLVKLGVDLSKIEKDRAMAEQLLWMDFDKDIKPVIQFLVDNRVNPDSLGKILTDNPQVIKEPRENLQTRIDYLMTKKLAMPVVAKIIESYPQFLGIPFKQVDARLGFVMQEYRLTANQVRSILVNYPALLGLHVMTIRLMTFSLKEELGLSPEDVRQIVVSVPQILGHDRQSAVNIFDMLVNVAGIPDKMVVKFPEVFLADEKTVKKRLDYLTLLKRNQFDPEKALYIPLCALSTGDDQLFVRKFARTSIEDYNLFLKSW